MSLDPTKVQRARERVMEKERIDGENAIKDSRVQSLIFKSRREYTKIRLEDDVGDEFKFEKSQF